RRGDRRRRLGRPEDDMRCAGGADFDEITLLTLHGAAHLRKERERHTVLSRGDGTKAHRLETLPLCLVAKVCEHAMLDATRERAAAEQEAVDIHAAFPGAGDDETDVAVITEPVRDGHRPGLGA